MSKIIGHYPALGYGFLTPYYDKIIGSVLPRSFRSEFVARMDIPWDAKILDFGTGTGEMILSLLDQYPLVEITGLDTDPIALKLARQKISKKNNVQVTQYDGGYLPFEDNHFDTVVSCLVFCNIGERGRFADEIYRVLKPNGRFYLCDFGYETKRWKRVIFRFLRSLSPLRALLKDSEDVVSRVLNDSKFNDLEFFYSINIITGTLNCCATVKR